MIKMVYARAVLLALALGQASATNCTSYPCDCENQPGECVVVGSYGEGGIANSGGVRPHISEENCNPGMVLVADPDQDGLRCKGKNEVFKENSNGCNQDQTCIDQCIAQCEAESACVAMSIGRNWCAGCETALDKVANNGAVAYKKVTKCGGEDLPIGSYCKFSFCPEAPTSQPTATPTTSSTSTTQCTPVVQTGPTCLDPPGQAPESEKVACVWPLGTGNYGIITKGDAEIPDKQIYKPILVGGDFDDTHNGNGQIASKCGQGTYNGQPVTPCSGNIPPRVPSTIGGSLTSLGGTEFKSGVETGQAPLYPTYLDYAALEELARTITAGTYGSGQNGHYVVVLTDTSTVREDGTQDLPSVNDWNEIRFSDYCTYNGCQDSQNGHFLIVIRSDRKIRLVKGPSNPEKMGAMILAPFSKVQVAADLDFVDGLIVAEELEMEGDGDQVQFHSFIYDGTLECRPCKDGCEPTTSTQECDSIASRSNTRTDLPKGYHSAPANERPWCYNLDVNKLADEGSSCDDYYSMGASGKVRLCVPDGTGDTATGVDGKCDSTAFFYCP